MLPWITVSDQSPLPSSSLFKGKSQKDTGNSKEAYVTLLWLPITQAQPTSCETLPTARSKHPPPSIPLSGLFSSSCLSHFVFLSKMQRFLQQVRCTPASEKPHLLFLKRKHASHRPPCCSSPQSLSSKTIFTGCISHHPPKHCIPTPLHSPTTPPLPLLLTSALTAILHAITCIHLAYYLSPLN